MKHSIKIFTTVTIFVVVILFLLSIAPHPLPHNAVKKRHLARPKMVPIETAIDEYYINTGQYPKTLDDLFICPPGLEDVWKGPYLKGKQTLDPWNNPFIYEPDINNSGDYDLISYGTDGAPGGEGENKDVSKRLIDAEKLKETPKKENSIKIMIVIGAFLLFIGAITIYKYITKSGHKRLTGTDINEDKRNSREN